MEATNITTPRVRVFESRTQRRSPSHIAHQPTKKRVCGYGRVSTDEEEQQSSYDLQVAHYTQFIKNNPEWEYAGVYADEGVTGTSTKKRDEFMRMIADCEAGKIDMIITKSISRFARNTLDCLEYVRRLKNLPNPVGVYFEKENLDSLDSKSELLLTILSSLAQDESRSISENVRWSLQKNYQQGKAKCTAKNFLGYDTDKRGNLIINEKQAKTVRKIHAAYLSGQGISQIATQLMKDHVPTGSGGKKWTRNAVYRILQNEKYCGDMLTGKRVTVDFLSHKRVPNQGQSPQYLVTNHHPAIITKEDWVATQAELLRRGQGINEDGTVTRRQSDKTAFSNNLICEACGHPLIRRTYTSHRKGTKYFYNAWRCKTAEGRVKGKKCSAPPCNEDALKKAFMDMLAEWKDKRDELTTMFETAITNLQPGEEEAARLMTIEAEIRIIEQRLAEAAESAKTSVVGDVYDDLAYDLGQRLSSLQDEHNTLNTIQHRANRMKTEFDWFMGRLIEIPDGVEFDEDLFRRAVNFGTVCVRESGDGQSVDDVEQMCSEGSTDQIDTEHSADNADQIAAEHSVEGTKPTQTGRIDYTLKCGITLAAYGNDATQKTF